MVEVKELSSYFFFGVDQVFLKPPGIAVSSRERWISSFVLLSPSLSVFQAGMCSSRGFCDGNNRSNRSSRSDSSGSGAHYALCALGLGLIALGVVMIVWTIIPMDGEASGGSTTTPAGNSSKPDVDEEEDKTDTTKSSTVAMVLVAVGVILLILSIGLGLRSKRRARNRGNQTTAAVLLASGLPAQQEP